MALEKFFNIEIMDKWLYKAPRIFFWYKDNMVNGETYNDYIALRNDLVMENWEGIPDNREESEKGMTFLSFPEYVGYSRVAPLIYKTDNSSLSNVAKEVSSN